VSIGLIHLSNYSHYIHYKESLQLSEVVSGHISSAFHYSNRASQAQSQSQTIGICTCIHGREKVTFTNDITASFTLLDLLQHALLL